MFCRASNLSKGFPQTAHPLYDGETETEQALDEIGAVIMLTITCQLFLTRGLMAHQFSEVEVKGANVAR